VLHRAASGAELRCEARVKCISEVQVFVCLADARRERIRARRAARNALGRLVLRCYTKQDDA
jgi:hypothetical protein